MSKAFTRDDGPGEAEAARPRESRLPPGARNYVTPDGADLLREQVASLTTQRAEAARRATGDDGADARRSLADVEARLALAREYLEAMEIVEPGAQDRSRVLFGATVKVRDGSGQEVSYRIVGAEEADPARHAISWFAPLASALLGTRVGDVVSFRSPRGEDELEVLRIEYPTRS